MNHTKIQWTERTWNPVRGCSRVSKGCEHCYAETVAHRFNGPGQPYEGLTVVNQSTGEPRWNGTVKLVEEHLLDPLKWQKPSMIFVNSMSDVFHEAVPDDYIDRMFAVMALAPQHTFQILTKRPERMQKYLSDPYRYVKIDTATRKIGLKGKAAPIQGNLPEGGWPLKNVWLGVSAEDQRTAEERIPILLQTPAAVRWISAEPLLAPVKLPLFYVPAGADPASMNKLEDARAVYIAQLACTEINWVVVGGESGPNARPFDLNWAFAIVHQCLEAEVACFVKQLGARPFDGTTPLALIDKKGGSMEEWPEELRIRNYPTLNSIA
jgi:protein gp37